MLWFKSPRPRRGSECHKLEKKLNEDQVRMGELEDQLKRTTVKTRRCRIQEKTRNLRKLIKKTKTELEKVKDIKDRPDDDCATHPYSKQIQQGEIRKAYALSRFMGISDQLFKHFWIYPSKRLRAYAFRISPSQIYFE